MKINFILGRSGSGKSTHILKEMVHANDNIVYIVPEQYSLQAERDILQYKKSTDINVLSFKRLAFRVFSQTGLKNKIVLDDVALVMLLRKIIIKVQGELTYYKQIKLRPGFIQSLAHTISELSRGGVNSSNMLPLLDLNTSLGLKCKDISIIYEAFLNFINENYISSDSALDILATKISDSMLIKNSRIYIDGFSSFTAQEYLVIQSLLTCSKDVTIAITTDEKKVTLNIDNLKQTDVFYETKVTISKLNDIAKKYSFKSSVLFLSENIRHTKNQDLLFLEENLFNLNKKFTTTTHNVSLNACSNSYKEVELISLKILENIREKGYKYSDIAVVASDTYYIPIRTIFKEYDIPFFIDSTRQISSHPLINTVLSAMGIVAKGWQNNLIFAFLKAGLVPINEIDVYELENYTIQYNINSYKWKFKEWKYGKQETYERINIIKSKVWSYLNTFFDCFKNEVNVKEASLNIFLALQNLGIFENLTDNSLPQDEVKQNIAIYDKLLHVMEVMVEFLGEEVLSPKQYLQVFEAGILQTTLGKVPETLDSVTIADINRSKLPNIKVLCVIGANEIGYVSNTSLYTDVEKAIINSFGVNLSISDTHIYKSNFAIYNYFTKPSQKLYITYATSTIESKPISSSPIVSILKSKNISDTVQFTYTSLKSMQKNLSLSLNGYYSTGIIQQDKLTYYNWLKNNNEIFINQIEEIAKGNKVVYLNKESINELYGQTIRTSVSRLETFSKCPFSYFNMYSLRAKERKIYEIQSLEIGDIFHEVIEVFTTTKEININTITKNEIQSTVSKILNEIKIKRQDLFENNRENYILSRIKRIAITSIWAMCNHLQMGKFIIYDTEVKFGGTSPINSIVVEIDSERKFLLEGRLDRVDVYENNNNTYVKIIDYKSGGKKFDKDEFEAGVQVQLIVYLYALLQYGEKYFNTNCNVMPGGVFYFKLSDPLIELQNNVDIPTNEKILKEFEMEGLVLKDNDVMFAINNDKNIIKTSSKNTLEYEEFEDILSESTNVLRHIGKKMIEGDISPRPFKKGNNTACDYCSYKRICNFKSRIYNRIS